MCAQATLMEDHVVARNRRWHFGLGFYGEDTPESILSYEQPAAQVSLWSGQAIKVD